MTGPFAVVSDDNRVVLEPHIPTWQEAVARRRRADREDRSHHWKIVAEGAKRR